ncbi:MAG: DUF2169 domain-containing protein [Polyangiaceae bacterium]
MKLLKPLRSTVIHRVFEHKKRFVLALTVGYCFRFDRPRALVSEPEMWKMAATDLGRFGVLDHWMWKPQAEVLVTGACYPGAPKGSDFVRLLVGPPERRLIDKRLYVFGDRRWTLLGPSEPAPFTRMPVDWAHAFGGPDFPQNPVGRGGSPTIDEATGAEDHFLPNVEDPKHLLTAPTERPHAVSLAAWDPMWPYHFEKKIGTYDKDWVRERGMSLADDFDPSLFNVAPPDQRVRGFFEGSEEIRVEHMHPDKRVLEARLPGYRARGFLRFTSAIDPSLRFVEVPLALDTIHLFPHRERAVVFFRGVHEIHSPDGSDVGVLGAGFDESIDDKRPAAYYEEVFARRLDKDKGPLHALRDAELLPPSADVRANLLEEDPIEEAMRREGLLEANAFRRAEAEYDRARDRLLAQGVDPSLIPPPPAPPPNAAPDLADLPAIADDARREAEARRGEADATLAAFAKEHGVDMGALAQQAKRAHAGPPKFSARAEIERLEQMALLSDHTGIEIDGVRERLADPNLLSSLLEIEQKLVVAYRTVAHLQEPAGEADAEASARARAEVRAVMLGATRDQRDFTGVDLSGEDLSGIDLSGAFLERANLEGANLRGANLKEAVLSRANLRGADLDGAELGRANLGRADARKANLRGTALEDAVLYEADLRDAVLDGATLSRATTLHCLCDGASFEGAHGEQLLFLKAELVGANLRGANFARSVFVDCDASRLDGRASDFSRAAFVRSKLDHARFTDAKAERFRLVESSATHADFSRASMMGSNLRGAKLEGATMRETRLRRSDLSEADLRDADLTCAVLAESLLIGADLSRARLAGVNLMLAIMHRAVLRGADASDANLFCADLTGAVGDDQTSFAGSNVKRALVAGVRHSVTPPAKDGEARG